MTKKFTAKTLQSFVDNVNSVLKLDPEYRHFVVDKANGAYRVVLLEMPNHGTRLTHTHSSSTPREVAQEFVIWLQHRAIEGYISQNDLTAILTLYVSLL